MYILYILQREAKKTIRQLNPAKPPILFENEIKELLEDLQGLHVRISMAISKYISMQRYYINDLTCAQKLAVKPA